MAQVARSFGISESCLNRWLRIADREDGQAAPASSSTPSHDSGEVSVVVQEATPDVLIEHLVAGDVDLVVGRLTSSDDELVDTVQLYSEPISIVVGLGHPATEVPDLRLADLVDHPWVLPVEQTALRTELEQAFAREGLHLPRNRVECTSFLALRTLVIEAGMVATLPTLIAREDERLVRLPSPPSVQRLRRLVGITVASGRRLSPAGELLLDQLKIVAARMQEDPD
jgi:DNA-binding transcriptional LysR family regulator